MLKHVILSIFYIRICAHPNDFSDIPRYSIEPYYIGHMFSSFYQSPPMRHMNDIREDYMPWDTTSFRRLQISVQAW